MIPIIALLALPFPLPPASDWPTLREVLAKNRLDVTIVKSGANSIAISVIEQDLRWRDNVTTEPVGPERRYTVTCDLSVSPAKCSR